jgi:hypothetical protein
MSIEEKTYSNSMCAYVNAFDYINLFRFIGKSTFINALLGQKLLKDGILPTTNKIHILRNRDKLNNDEMAGHYTQCLSIVLLTNYIIYHFELII